MMRARRMLSDSLLSNQMTRSREVITLLTGGLVGLAQFGSLL